MSARDPMRELVASFPEMLEAAWAAGVPEGMPLARGRCCFLGGMGGSGMAGAVAATILDADRRLAAAWSHPEPPGWLDASDRAIIVSYSGETWEASALLEACLSRSIPSCVVSSGGRLTERCRKGAIPLFPVPGGMQPRAALPWLLGGVLRAAGGASDERIASAVTLLQGERAHPSEGRDPAEIAAAMEGRLVVLLPIGPIMEVAARRWRTQILENAKQPALLAPIPEACHNEIMGWSWMREAEIPVSFFVLSDAQHERAPWESVSRAIEDEAHRCGHRLHRIPPHPAGGAAGLLADLFLADRVSVELADRRGVDATPVEAITRFRRAIIRGKGG
jgi:glucose/mannose-6-phosphate isomerase